MGSLPKCDSELFQNSINYLHKISSLTYSPPALKCLYLTKASLMELKKYVDAPSVVKSTVRCQRCCMSIANGSASYRIKPQEKKSKFARKLLARSEQDKPMTKYQRKYFKRLSNFNGNQLVITCKFCRKESFVKLEKPKKVQIKKLKRLVQKKKKKIKKKDKFCGLDQQVVLSLTAENVGNLDTSAQKKKKKVKKKDKLYGHGHGQQVLSLTTKNVRNLGTSAKKKKKMVKKKDKLCGLSQPVLSFTADNVRNLDTSTFISLEGNTKSSRVKLTKKADLKETIEEVVTKESIKKNEKKLKKKNKLKEFLSASSSSKSNSSSNLKNFLQSL